MTGVDFVPNTRRLVACTERSICIWDIRSKGKNQVSDMSRRQGLLLKTSKLVFSKMGTHLVLVKFVKNLELFVKLVFLYSKCSP